MKRHAHSTSARTAPRRPRSARAFTLVELLVVITIIGILAGLGTAAFIRARIAAKNTAIGMELNQLEMALKAYKEKFGEYPPDFAGVNVGGDDQTNARDAVMRHIRKAFPRCTTMPDWATFEAFMLGNSIPMTPQSALVFWLGGMKDATTGQPIGFSADPTNPFNNSSTSRIGPFYDFDQTRLNVPNGYLYWPKEADNHAAGTGAITYFRAENGGYTYPTSGNYKTAADAGGATIYPAVDSRLLAVSPSPWINDKSVQIFTSGLDKTYSNLTSAGPLQFPSGSNYDPVTGFTYDDITNFSGGTLEDAMP